MTVQEAIEDAERILPGEPAPDGEIDPRWQAIIAVGFFIPTDGEAVWAFIQRWGCHENEDLRTGIATCLLEDLLDERFEEFFPKVEAAVRASALFADTFARCWKIGEAKQPGNAERFDRLKRECRFVMARAPTEL